MRMRMLGFWYSVERVLGHKDVSVFDMRREIWRCARQGAAGNGMGMKVD